MSQFRFKQFTVTQDNTPMKVGTDGVLIGAWVNIHKSVDRILDIGTATGVIALIAAQRSNASTIVGVDINSVEDAIQNGANSPWSDRVQFLQQPIQEYSPEQKFDLIISNPPYFVDSLLCDDDGRTAARHTTELSFEELISSTVRLLNPNGELAIILPTTEAQIFDNQLNERLYIKRRCNVRTKPNGVVKRIMTQYSLTPTTTQIEELTIGTGVHEQYSEQYRELTKDFYLKF